MSNITRLPVQKINMSASEKLLEFSKSAEETPEKFEHMVIIYGNKEGTILWSTHGEMNLVETIALVETCKLSMFENLRS